MKGAERATTGRETRAKERVVAAAAAMTCAGTTTGRETHAKERAVAAAAAMMCAGTTTGSVIPVEERETAAVVVMDARTARPARVDADALPVRRETTNVVTAPVAAMTSLAWAMARSAVP